MSANDTPATAAAKTEITLDLPGGKRLTIPKNKRLFGHVNGEFFYFTHIQFRAMGMGKEIPCRIPVTMLEVVEGKEQDT